MSFIQHSTTSTGSYHNQMQRQQICRHPPLTEYQTPRYTYELFGRCNSLLQIYMIDDRGARGGEDSNVKRGTSHTVLTEIIILSSQWRGCTPGRVTEMGIL